MGARLRLLRAGVAFSRARSFIPPHLRKKLPITLKTALGALSPLAPRSPSPKIAQRLASSLQRLGPSYVKMGQFLAARPDIVGHDLADALSLLQDRMNPFPLHVAVSILQNNPRLAPLTKTLSPPVAAASVAQVHFAQRPDNPQQRLAVKILRPNALKILQHDVSLWRKIAKHAPPSAQRLQPQLVVEEIQRWIRAETDMRTEAASMHEFSQLQQEYAQSTNDPLQFVVPNVHWDFLAHNVLVMDQLSGTPINDVKTLKKLNHNLPLIASRLLQTFLHHALSFGVHHADLHRGNLFVLNDGRIGAVDFGVVGRLDPHTSRTLALILHGLAVGNYQQAAAAHLHADYLPQSQNLRDFALALRAMGEPLRHKPSSLISMADVLSQLFITSARFSMPLQPQLLLLQKTMLAAEGIARSLDPNVNFWNVCQPILEHHVRRHAHPQQRARFLFNDAAELLSLARRRLTAPTPPSPPPTKTSKFSVLLLLLLGAALGAAVAFLLPSLLHSLTIPP